MRRRLAIGLVVLLILGIIFDATGIHRASNLYKCDSDEQVQEIQEKSIQEENEHHTYSYINSNLKSGMLKSGLETIGYNTKKIENGDNDFYQSVSSDGRILVNYDITDTISSIEIRYKFDRSLETIKEEDPLTELWCEISGIVGNKDDYKMEFVSFVRNYKELNGKSCEFGNVNLYSQIYGNEFYVIIEGK